MGVGEEQYVEGATLYFSGCSRLFSRAVPGQFAEAVRGPGNYPRSIRHSSSPTNPRSAPKMIKVSAMVLRPRMLWQPLLTDLLPSS